MNRFETIFLTGIDLSNNQIKELKNLPKEVNGILNLNNNNIEILENLPEKVYQSLSFKNNPLIKIKKFPVGKILILDDYIINLLESDVIEHILQSPLDNVEINGRQNPLLGLRMLESKMKMNNIQKNLITNNKKANKI